MERERRDGHEKGCETSQQKEMKQRQGQKEREGKAGTFLFRSYPWDRACSQASKPGQLGQGSPCGGGYECFLSLRSQT